MASSHGQKNSNQSQKHKDLNLSDKEFKITVLRKLNGLQEDTMNSGKQYLNKISLTKEILKNKPNRNTGTEEYNEFSKKSNNINIRIDQAKKESVSKKAGIL